MLERSGAAGPDSMLHVLLRVSDVMQESFPIADHGSRSARSAGRWRRGDLDLVPIVGDEGELIGS